MLNEQNYNELDFASIRIGLASPETIRSWSYGEVKKPETINYRTLKPEMDGLFCERIFGPVKDWECHCGKYKRIRWKGKICDKCGVKVTRAKVRRERMGHIELASPVSHIWYFKGTPSRIAVALDIKPSDLEKVLYFSSYIVIDSDEPSLTKCQILSDRQYLDACESYAGSFRAGMGAEAIQELLSGIDLEKTCAELREQLAEIEATAGGKEAVSKGSGQSKGAKLTKRLEVLEAFKDSGNRPEWMILSVLPVIPPDIRPMVQLEGGRFAASDLNELYRRVINRNNRLRKLLEMGAPEIIVRNEKRMLQEAVDALIDNTRRGKPVTGSNNRALKSLSDYLKGKQGRFRQNLLGKRVDYSGRSVIVVGPELKIYQCGLPKEMALELFKPFVIKRLMEIDSSKYNPRSAKKAVEKGETLVWDALDTIISDHPVLLNRAPTLHRLGIQAFEPVLVEGKAIKLHPLVCTPFNADFDGDQMAVHVPLSAEAQAEARILMFACNNLLKPSDGKPVTVPTQDMVLGSYYLTLDIEGAKGEGNVYRDVDEAAVAYEMGDLDLHAKIKVRITRVIDGVKRSGIIETTYGKVIFNRPIPQDLGFIDRSIPGNEFRLEIEDLVNKKKLGKIVDACIRVHGVHEAAIILDDIKSQGYKYATLSGITVGVFDAAIPESKNEYLREAEEKIDIINESFEMGESTAADRSQALIRTWRDCTDKIKGELTKGLSKTNPIFMMVDSGARGNMGQLNQVAGMLGLMNSTTGQVIEVPIRANYREGLNVLEYFISSRGARKGLTDTALRTADSGYLTRRLVDVSQDIIIREEDCGCKHGIVVSDIRGEEDSLIESFEERLIGRYLVHPVCDPETGEVIKDADTMITIDDARRIVAAGVTSAEIRSPLTCESKHGICVKCYGSDLTTGNPISIGEAVGIFAAQSIGEPGTQLTMRNFHSGGVMTASDITQGLPRVEELFEARKPKVLTVLSRTRGIVTVLQDDIKKTKSILVTPGAKYEIAKKQRVSVSDGDLIEAGHEIAKGIISDVAGVVRIVRHDEGRTVFVEDTSVKPEKYNVLYNSVIKVADNDEVQVGTYMTEGSCYPHDILDTLGEDALRNYLIDEVQSVYRLQGVDINDKHIEVIVRHMLSKVSVDDEGSTRLLPGTTVDKREYAAANEEAKAEAERNGTEFVPAVCHPVVLGITKVALATDSFLSAASFQETTRVLTDAAIRGKNDPLLGIKENVIIGKLLPCGTGMKVYSDVQITKGANKDSPFYAVLEQMNA